MKWKINIRASCTREGNRVAQDLVNKVFEVCDRKWRGSRLDSEEWLQTAL